MPASIPQEDAQQVLRYVRALALRQWRQDHYSADLAEYEDAGMAALSSCLKWYDPQCDSSFSHYAGYRIRGAMQDARQGYQAWRQGDVSARGRRRGRTQPAPWADALWPSDPQPADTLFVTWLHRQAATLPPIQRTILTSLLGGETRAEIARARGVTEGAVLLQYRKLLTNLRARLQHPDNPAAVPD
jgi:DNA-directed RNA polymerase specialized sigma subunit